MSLVGAMVETLGVSVILPLVQVLLEPQKLFEIKIMEDICNWFDITEENQIFVLIATGVIVVYILKNAYMCLLSYARVKYSTKVQRELSIRMLRSYMNRGYVFFRTTNTANLLRGINGAVLGIYNILYQFMRIIAEVLTMGSK